MGPTSHKSQQWKYNINSILLVISILCGTITHANAYTIPTRWVSALCSVCLIFALTRLVVPSRAIEGGASSAMLSYSLLRVSTGKYPLVVDQVSRERRTRTHTRTSRPTIVIIVSTQSVRRRISLFSRYSGWLSWVRLMLRTHGVENRRRFSEVKIGTDFGTCVIRKRLRFSTPITSLVFSGCFWRARDWNKQ